MSVIDEWNRVNRTKKREAIEMEYQLARGEIYEIPSEESHQGEPSTKRISQLENEEDIYDDAITNDSKDDVMGNNEAFESSGCEDDNEPSMDFFNFENAVSYVAAIFLHNNFSDSVAKDIFTIGKVLNQYPSIKLVSPQYLIWTISYRPNSGRRDDKHFDRFPETLVTVLKDFGMDAIANYVPTRLLPADADMEDKFVKGLPYPFEEACKEIVRRRNSYESADKLVRHAIHGALQLLRTYHYDTATGILVNCKKRSECSTHLTWKDYKSKLEVGDQDA